MPDLSTELLNILRAPKADLWRKSLKSVLLGELTQKAAKMIDFERIILSDDWENLDNARYRERLIPSNNDIWQKCIIVLLQNKKQINQELKAKGFNGQSTSQLHSRLAVVLSALLRSSSRSAAQESPFPLLWYELANFLAAKIFSECRANPNFSEQSLHQELLFVSMLWSCRFPEAKYLRQFLNNSENLPNGLRGKLFRIPETISADGILDKPLPLSSHPKITSLKFESESDLVFETVEETRMTLMNDGFCHRVMKTDTELETDQIGIIQITNDARSKLFQMYEHEMLAYMALSGVEQMLRTWAESMRVKHLKSNGHPKGVLDWIDHLSPTPGLRATIDEFYNPEYSNIRNRLMHGNLLEIENKSLEMFLHIVQPRQERPDIVNDAFTSHNIANLCLNC
jgi:hypothetical protein